MIRVKTMLAKSLVLPTTYRMPQFSINDSLRRRELLLEQAIIRSRQLPTARVNK